MWLVHFHDICCFFHFQVLAPAATPPIQQLDAAAAVLPLADGTSSYGKRPRTSDLLAQHQEEGEMPQTISFLTVTLVDVVRG